jgi:VCBS repeat-containing protein
MFRRFARGLGYQFAKALRVALPEKTRETPLPARPATIKVDACVLESRILYSASAFPCDDPLWDGDAQAEISLSDVEALLQAWAAAEGAPWVHSPPADVLAPAAPTSDAEPALQELSDDAPPLLELVESTAADKSVVIIFVDGAVANAEQIAEQLRDEASVFGSPTSRDHVELVVYLLDSNHDGLSQVTHFLGQHQAVDSVHFLSHGTSRAVKLGATWIDSDVLSAREHEFRNWRGVLAEHADLLFYSCDLAASDVGRDMLERIAQWTGADVAASDNATGASVLGGDWILEYHYGSVESTIAVGLELQERWEGLLATFIVTNTNNTGAGSLRQAILDANALAGTDTITFNLARGIAGYFDPTPGSPLSGDEYWQISVTSSLPTVSGSVIIDGTTQPGWNGSPVILLSGASAPGGTNGLTITAGNSTVRGLVIASFSGAGIRLDTNGNNVIQGNYFGTDITGTQARGNNTGLFVVNSAGNLIGGTTSQTRNLFSGNTTRGIYLYGSGSTGNAVQGNFIGLNVTGTQALSNAQFGVHAAFGAGSNTIGGVVAGAGNVISGNSTIGVYLQTSNNVVAGNLIGLNATGTNAIGNGNGVRVVQSTGNIIGGIHPHARNVISGSGFDGIFVTSEGAHTQILGNYIGTDITGLVAIGNLRHGINIAIGATDTIVGGTTAGAGNVISNNGSSGISSSTLRSVIQGNIIGLDALGAAAMGNGTGIRLVSGSSSSLIGGTVAAARNIISANILDGIHIATSSSSLHTVQGNFIGTDLSGLAAFGNGRDGVRVDVLTSGNTIGGHAPGAGNLISGNLGNGITLMGNSNTVAGNIIGLAANGQTPLANQRGIVIDHAQNNVIGGASLASRNVISGNTLEGIRITGSSSTANSVVGNFIGTNVSGSAAAGNGTFGILIDADANGQVLGGDASGAGNLISGNLAGGISLAASNILVAGNLIGTDASGLLAIGNAGHGIVVSGASLSGIQIGGNHAGAGNIIAANGSFAAGAGIWLDGGTGTVIEGNRIGVGLDDSVTLATVQFAGIVIEAGASGTRIGGLHPAAGNIIARNGAGGGVAIAAGSVGNSLLRNRFFGNAGLAIDLGRDGVSANTDNRDATAANFSMNHPVLTQSGLDGNALLVAGFIGLEHLSALFGSASVEFFIQDPQSIHGSGRTYLGSLTADANGLFQGTLDVSALNLTYTQQITATATDEWSNTSEFALPRNITSVILAANDSGAAIEAGGVDNQTSGAAASGNVLANDTTHPDGIPAIVGVAPGSAPYPSSDVGLPVTGLYGSLVIQANGDYTYTVDDLHPLVQALRSASEQLEDVFTYSVADNLGGSATAYLTIVISGANDAPQTPLAGDLRVDENAPAGTLVGTVSSLDVDSGDSVSFSLLDDAGGRFAIDEHTGVIRVSSGAILDAEQSPSLQITVRATDLAGAFADQTFTIAIEDVNEHSVSAIVDTDTDLNIVLENVAPGTRVGIVALAADADATNNLVTYSLLDSAGGRFAIDPQTGEVTVAGMLDRELADSYTITVQATSADGSISTRDFTIAIDDVNEHSVSAIVDTDTDLNSVLENVAPGTRVGIVAFAADADATNNLVTYSLLDSAGGRFAIDPQTGEVTVAAQGGTLARGVQTIVVQAASTGGDATTAVFEILVRPQFTANPLDAIKIGAPSELDFLRAAVWLVVGQNNDEAGLRNMLNEFATRSEDSGAGCVGLAELRAPAAVLSWDAMNWATLGNGVVDGQAIVALAAAGSPYVVPWATTTFHDERETGGNLQGPLAEQSAGLEFASDRPLRLGRHGRLGEGPHLSLARRPVLPNAAGDYVLLDLDGQADERIRFDTGQPAAWTLLGAWLVLASAKAGQYLSNLYERPKI